MCGHGVAQTAKDQRGIPPGIRTHLRRSSDHVIREIAADVDHVFQTLRSEIEQVLCRYLATSGVARLQLRYRSLDGGLLRRRFRVSDSLIQKSSHFGFTAGHRQVERYTQPVHELRSIAAVSGNRIKEEFEALHSPLQHELFGRLRSHPHVRRLGQRPLKIRDGRITKGADELIGKARKICSP